MKYEDRPVLGARVVSHEKMYKVGWPQRIWKSMSLGRPIHGIYAGYRILQDGRIETDYDEGNTFTQTGTVRCALITPNERTNPIRVPFKGLSLEETDDGEMH